MSQFASRIAEGARRAREAQRAWDRGERGHYVFNVGTKIIVRGPFETRDRAQVEADAETHASWGVTSR